MTEAVQSAIPAAVGAAASPGRPTSVDQMREVAQEFEAVFLAQVLSRINQGFGTDPAAGEAPDQALFHDMFNDEVAKLISRSGGIGVGDAVLKEMLKVQEVA